MPDKLGVRYSLRRLPPLQFILPLEGEEKATTPTPDVNETVATL